MPWAEVLVHFHCPALSFPLSPSTLGCPASPQLSPWCWGLRASACMWGSTASHLPVAQPGPWPSHNVHLHQHYSSWHGTAGGNGASYPSTLCFCVARMFIACLLTGAVWAVVLTWHTCVLAHPPLFRPGGHPGLWCGETRSVFIGSKAREKQPVPCLRGEGCSCARGILFIHG